jgi:hypothetical protein
MPPSYPVTTEALAEVFSDSSMQQAKRDFESALARTGEFHGATSQDVYDTAMVLLLRRARPILAGYQRGLTDGLEGALWSAAVEASWKRFDARFDEALLLQFSGSRDVGDALAAEFGLTNPVVPWHRRRDRIAAIVCSGAIYIGVLGRMARDIQDVSKSVVPLAAAARMPGLAASFLSAMVQEDGWPLEAPIVSDAIQTIGAAIEAMAAAVTDLEE